MKKLTFIFLLISLVSCGKKTKSVQYIENPYDDSNIKDRVTDLEQRISALELSHLSAVSSINSLQESFNEIYFGQESISDRLDELQLLDSQIQTLQQLANTQQALLTTLSTNENIVSFIDPCGKSAQAFDEVILKTSSGKYVAYFEDGGKRFLTVLENGASYQTTDRQKCDFYVDQDGTLTW